MFAEHFCIWLCCEYLQSISVFCRAFLYLVVLSVCRAFLYLVVLRVFAEHFCIWLCCECLQSISVFGCVVSISSCQTDVDVFLIC